MTKRALISLGPLHRYIVKYETNPPLQTINSFVGKQNSSTTSARSKAMTQQFQLGLPGSVSQALKASKTQQSGATAPVET